MGLPKNRTNNPNGRPKGVPNKHTASMRSKIDTLLSENWNKIQADLDSLEPKDRLAFIERLLNYSVPKLASTSAEIDVVSKLESLNNQQLESLIDGILNKQEDETPLNN